MAKTPYMELDIINEAYEKVVMWFFAYPDKKINLTELAINLKIAKKTASKIIEQLVKEGFLIKEVIGKSWQVACNKSHQYNYSKKIAYNLMLVYESDILKKIHELQNKYGQKKEDFSISNPAAIILFGSYRKGDDTEKSDIDIAIEVKGDKQLVIHKMGAIEKLGYRKNVYVNLHIFSRNKIDLNLFTNIANGIVLEGFLEVKP